MTDVTALDSSGVLAVEHRDTVTVLRMDSGENRFHPDLLSALESGVEQAGNREGAGALVLTGTGKFFSNGLDLEYLGAHPSEAPELLERVHRLFGHLLSLDIPTVVALNGHAFAAGAMLALSCDLAVMRADRGYLCLPEADLGLPFTPGMSALLSARLSPPAAHRAMVLGHRYTAQEALAEGIIRELVPEHEVLERAVTLAEELAGKPRAGLAAIKRGIYADVIDLLLGKSGTSEG